MFVSFEDVPEYLCDQCDHCSYIEEMGYCPYVVEECDSNDC